MCARNPQYSWLLAGTLAVIAASAVGANAAGVAMVETQPWDTPRARVSPAATQAAITQVMLAQGQSTAAVRGYPVNDTAMRGASTRSMHVALLNDTSMHGAIAEPAKHIESSPNGCTGNGGKLCYDYRSGQAVYKPMRSLLPQIPGMTAQNLAIHRNRNVAQYTFK